MPARQAYSHSASVGRPPWPFHFKKATTFSPNFSASNHVTVSTGWLDVSRPATLLTHLPPGLKLLGLFPIIRWNCFCVTSYLPR